MQTQDIFLGEHCLKAVRPEISEGQTIIDGVTHYTIDGYDHMDPFFMSVISHSDHWMYLSSLGGLTAGRRSPDHALFPYYTDDKIHDAAQTTGPITYIFVKRENNVYLWEPFAGSWPGRIYQNRRRLHKSVNGNRVVFEEINTDLGLTFSYRWEFSERFGIVRTARVINDLPVYVEMDILDGLRNILPAGSDRVTQERLSTLMDGYKQSEIDPETGAGFFTLSSIISDRAEPSEALNATTVWHSGLKDPVVLLSTDQVETFIEGGQVNPETYLRGRRGAYILKASLCLEGNQSHSWMMAADVEQDRGAVVDTLMVMRSESPESISSIVKQDIESGTMELRRLISASDGLQSTGDRRIVGRHESNVLFNIMRGGIFSDGYRINRDDFSEFVSSWNFPLAKRYREFLDRLPASVHRLDLIEMLLSDAAEHDPDLIRLACEYLPLTFSRRHGDPSRPWNKFSIDLRKPDGSRAIAYQGNWRDIFQNWEALAISYPAYLDGMITRFLNASTADGYNPYRISNEGIDWEVYDPDDPWSNIGYWGDHQIIYLCRLLELYYRHFPRSFDTVLKTRRYVFAHVPYRIRKFHEIIKDPRNTIDIDEELQRTIDERVRLIGADGKLLHAGEKPYYSSFIEKILIPVLTKMSNFLPGGGIWMNTQRPEWNDANNALVGWGLSMVTVCYLRRYLVFLLSVLSDDQSGEKVPLTSATVEFLNTLSDVLERFSGSYAAANDQERSDFLEACGLAGERYREAVYSGAFGSEQIYVPMSKIQETFSQCIKYLDHTIRENRRDDGLYHSYNIMIRYEGGISIGRLDEMLEGQVAVLSSGLLPAGEVDELLSALRRSRLYRDDQNSYMLYPDKDLPRFLEKNLIPAEAVLRSPFLQREADNRSDGIVKQDQTGAYYFNSSLRNSRFLSEALDEAALDEDVTLSAEERAYILELYEDVFSHKTFTGRSGTFFKYEGLGSIYWHMVSKLLVAVQENCISAAEHEASQEIMDSLTAQYHQIREGLGIHKTSAEYGAFPVDPYSHTPGFAGVQQPGMTGQVKEDIIARFGELGFGVFSGKIRFQPRLLQSDEFLSEETMFTYTDLSGNWNEIRIPAKALVFTCCSVPVLYRLANEARVYVYLTDDTERVFEGSELDHELSTALFHRTGRIQRIEVDVVL